ncbi:MAG: MerC domain-containing protein [Verrucomicrobiales bacterium]|nr:MerC domain-containing protein [Verrucomicrobiales bacterium]
MNTAVNPPLSIPAPQRHDADRVGIIASALCAVHCAITPVLLILAPSFGQWWSHPASHWLVALFVVPLAFAMLLRGFRHHRRKWIVACGFLGMFLVVVGAIIPYLGPPSACAKEAASENSAPAAEEDFVYVVGEEEISETNDTSEASPCLDACCPSLVTDSEGRTSLHIPTASLVTTLGGVALIMTHLGNLCACRRAGNRQCCDGSGSCSGQVS